MAKKWVSLPTAYQHPRAQAKPPRNNAALWFCLCLLVIFAVLIAGCTTDTRGRPGTAGAPGFNGTPGAPGGGNMTANMTAGPNNDAWYYWSNTTRPLNPGTSDANLFRNTTAGSTLLRGGTMTAGSGGVVQVAGKDLMPDAILFYVPDTTTSIDQLVATFVGQVSPPYLDMEMHQIKRVLNPTDAQDAVTLNYAGLNYAALGSLANYYLRDTSQSLTGNSIYRSVTNDVLSLYGSTAADPYGAMLHLYGEDSVPQSGGAIFSVGNAAGNAGVPVWSVLGRTDTPYLDLNNNQIKNMADPTAAQDAVTLNKLGTYVGNNTVNTSYDTIANNTNFLYKPGLDGGQWVNGGTAPTDNLTLNGTISSTKTFGDVIINGDGGKVKVGTTISRTVDNSYLDIFGGVNTSINHNPVIEMLGGDYSGGTYAGSFFFVVPNTGLSGSTLSLFIKGRTDTPQVGIGAAPSNNNLQIGSVGGYTGNEFAIGAAGRQFAIDVDATGTNLYSDSAIILAPSSAEKVRITSTGVGIGMIPTLQLELSTDSAGKPTSEHWTVVSDERLKKDIVPITNALDILSQLHPKEFGYIDTNKSGTARQYGFIAQDVEKTISQWVKTDADGYKTITITGDTALLVQAIKEQQEIIDDKQGQIDNLTKRMEALEKKVGIR